MDCNETFNVRTEFINDNLQISIFEIKELNEEIQSFLDENLVQICEGKNSSTDINVVKERVSKLFKNKNITWKMGAIAEFFIHLYITSNGYTQDCLFINLEEGSIKKGFDGYYHNENNQWIMESKSGSILTKNISHKTKINEAINDLKDKFEGRVKNNPWKNAYNHASHCDVGTPEDIKRSIKKLSDDYTLEKFYQLDDFNIIPCATIFLSKVWEPENKEKIIEDIKSIVKNVGYKKTHLVCVTQQSIEIFEQYIK